MKAAASHTRSFDETPRAEEGETIAFGHFDPKNPAWFFGRDARGIEGYFPSGWFDVFEATGSARALRDYDAFELSVTDGERIEAEEEYGGWVLVVSSDGRGWIPLSCVPQEAANGREGISP